MSRILLHIGQHRTGMRTVQDLFFAKREILEQNHILYPDLDSNRAHHVLAAPWISLPGLAEGYFGSAGPEQPWHRLAALYHGWKHAKDGCLLLSAEAFSRASPKSVDMVALAERLSTFGKVQLVVTLRPQHSLLPALWLELARHQVPPTPAPFIAQALRDQTAAGLWLDYNRLYDHLCRGFAPEQITVLNMAQVASPHSLATALLDLAAPGRGADLATQMLAPTQPAPDTFDAAPLAVFATSRITATSPPDPALVARIAPAFGTARQNLFTRAEHAQMTAVFASLNAAFEARLQHTQPGFALTPAAEPAPDTLWRDDLTPDNWADIATALYRSGLNPEVLKDSEATLLHKAWRRILDLCLG